MPDTEFKIGEICYLVNGDTVLMPPNDNPCRKVIIIEQYAGRNRTIYQWSAEEVETGHSWAVKNEWLRKPDHPEVKAFLEEDNMQIPENPPFGYVCYAKRQGASRSLLGVPLRVVSVKPTGVMVAYKPFGTGTMDTGSIRRDLLRTPMKSDPKLRFSPEWVWRHMLHNGARIERSLNRFPTEAKRKAHIKKLHRYFTAMGGKYGVTQDIYNYGQSALVVCACGLEFAEYYHADRLNIGPKCAAELNTCQHCGRRVGDDLTEVLCGAGPSFNEQEWCNTCLAHNAMRWNYLEEDEDGEETLSEDVDESCWHDRPQYTMTEGGDNRGILNYSADVFTKAKASRNKRGCQAVVVKEGELALEPLDVSKFYFGVELETETRLTFPEVAKHFPKVSKADVFIAKHDGSLGMGGMELVTLPMTMEAQRLFWRGLEEKDLRGKLLSYNGTDGRCGCHIHISRGPMPFAQIQAVDYLVGHDVNRALTEHIARRLNAIYCAKHKKRKEQLGEDCGHHNAVCVSHHYPTLEVRIYKGTSFYPGLCIYLDHAESIVEFTSQVVALREGKKYQHDEPAPPGALEYLAWLDKLPEDRYLALRAHVVKFDRDKQTLPEKLVRGTPSQVATWEKNSEYLYSMLSGQDY